MPGTLIVLEGVDGSGKSTQFARLCQRLEGEGVQFHKLAFPQYSEPSSALLRMYLNGEFGGSPGDVNAYAASAFYAVDRYASWKKVWGEPYTRGELMLADRYITSNAVHQACKLPEGEWEDFFRWLVEFECDKLGLPRPNLVICLDMPTETGSALLRQREAAGNVSGDIHEVDGHYLSLCRRTARAAAHFFGWQVVCATDPVGKLRPVEEIHQEIWALIQPVLARQGTI